MPEGITEDEKAIIKRVVPSAQNKILAAAMARLYIAYPNRSKWTYTGLQGAIVLANDLIGNTYWIKLVDVSVCTRFMLNIRHLLTTAPSHPREASYGIKKSTSNGVTAKTESSFTASRSRTVLLASLSPTTRRPRSS